MDGKVAFDIRMSPRLTISDIRCTALFSMLPRIRVQCWGDVPAFRGGGDNGPYGIRHLGSFVRIQKKSVNTSGEIESSRLGMLRLSASGTIHYCSGLGSFVDKLLSTFALYATCGSVYLRAATWVRATPIDLPRVHPNQYRIEHRNTLCIH